jgi:hypothetical protein
MRFYLFTILLAIFTLVSCSNGNGCYESVDTLMVTSFSIDSLKQVKTLVISGFGRNDVGDTLVNDRDSTLTKRYNLPLSLSADSTGWVLEANGKKDTLFIRHTMIMGFVSESCGFAPNYIISSLRFTAGIDSVKISDSKVNPKSIEKKTNDQNISIYFSPAAH